MIRRGALIVDGTYRYKLWRKWDDSKPLIMYIMLNPSRANDKLDDPTIRRLIQFSIEMGYGGFYVGNIYAYINSNPLELFLQKRMGINITGEWNMEHLRRMGRKVDEVCFAWGANYDIPEKHWLKRLFPNALCFGHTKDGNPKHPLYLPKKTKLIPYVTRAELYTQ